MPFKVVKKEEDGKRCLLNAVLVPSPLLWDFTFPIIFSPKGAVYDKVVCFIDGKNESSESCINTHLAKLEQRFTSWSVFSHLCGYNSTEPTTPNQRNLLRGSSVWAEPWNLSRRTSGEWGEQGHFRQREGSVTEYGTWWTKIAARA